jgi:hypothetical protein
MGPLALWALTGHTKIAKYRGSIIEHTLGGKLLATFHPTSVIKQYSNRVVVGADFIKARQEAAYPEFRRTIRHVYLEPTVKDVREYIASIVEGGKRVAFDIETAKGQITCIGLARSPEDSIVIPFINADWSSYWATPADELAVTICIKRLLEDPEIIKIAQNNLYDVSWLQRKLGIKVRGKIEDTMHMHHALQPEMRKGLDYLASIYTNDPPWKNMANHKGNKRDE